MNAAVSPLTEEHKAYLKERGFLADGYFGREFNRYVGGVAYQRVSWYSDGWFAHTSVWTTEAMPDPITAFVSAELENWGRN